jgi:hypothetical protein
MDYITIGDKNVKLETIISQPDNVVALLHDSYENNYKEILLKFQEILKHVETLKCYKLYKISHDSLVDALNY